MNRLIMTMNDLRNRRESALIPFLMAGDPCLKATETLMKVLAENGADVIELGMPFSDPLADGAVLQAAAQRALTRGVTVDDVFALAKGFTDHYSTPLLLLVYYNMVFQLGPAEFCQKAAQAGISGLVVPDLPFEEAGELEAYAKREGLVNIRFLSPTTSEARIKKICQGAEGFIYCVAVTGVTGEREGMDEAVAETLRRAKGYTDVPLALGFGIAGPTQAARAAALADAVIVGSALAARLEATDGLAEKKERAVFFVRSLKEALRGPTRGA